MGFLDGHFNVRFAPIGNYRKLLADQQTGDAVLVFGGVGNWHGLDEGLMKAASVIRQTKGAHYFILADKQYDRVDIFGGPLDVFVDEKDALLRNQDGDYQFQHQRVGDKVFLKEASSLELHLLGTVKP